MAYSRHGDRYGKKGAGCQRSRPSSLIAFNRRWLKSSVKYFVMLQTVLAMFLSLDVVVVVEG